MSASSSQMMDSGDGGVNPSPKQGELDKLSKDNFNLKLQLFYLQKKLRKYESGLVGESDEDLYQELQDRQMELDHKNQEVDELKLLLSKSRSVIESLHTDLALCKAELEESRNNQVDPEVLKDKEIEIDACKHRIRELEEKDRRRVEDILALNNQLNDAKEKGQMERTELRAESLQRQELERELVKVKEDNKSLAAQLAEKLETLQRSTGSFDEVRDELDSVRAKLIQNSKTLGDMRLREQDLSRQLQQCEIERDKNMRACALAERKAEDQEALLEEARQTVSRLQERTRELEMEKKHLEQMYASKEQAMRAQSELGNEELRKQYVNHEMELKAQISEWKGRANALEATQEETRHAYREEQHRTRALEEEVQRLRELLEVEKERSQNNGAGLETKLEEQRHALEKEQELRKNAEAELEFALNKSTKREKELRRQVKEWEHQIIAKLDEIVPADQIVSIPSPTFSEDSSPSSSPKHHLDENDFMRINRKHHQRPNSAARKQHSARHGNRPEPRRLYSAQHDLEDEFDDYHDELEGEFAFRGGSGHKKKKNTSGSRSGQNLMVRLDYLRGVKNEFNTEVWKIEQKWQNKVRTLATRLAHSENRLQVSEGKLEIFLRSMETFAKQNTMTLKGQQQDLEKRNASLAHEFRSERVEYEQRVRQLEAQLHRTFEEKERLHDQLASSKEKSAHLEGELRQAKAELDSLREEKTRADLKLEKFYGSQGVLEENNRLMSQELDDRSNKIALMNDIQNQLKQKVQDMKLKIREQEKKIMSLEKKLEQAKQQIKLRDKQIRDSKAKIDQTVQRFSPKNASSSSHSPDFSNADDFERTMWRQVEETELAIRSSSNTPRKTGYQGGTGVMQSYRHELERDSERFSEVLIAAAELVEKTQSILSRYAHSPNLPQEAYDLIRINHRLAKDLQSCGHDINILHQKLLNAAVPTASGARQRATSTSALPYSAHNSFTPERKRVSSARKRLDSLQGSTALSSVHKDMLGRLGKIRNDLQDTATQLNFNKFE